MSKTRRMAGKKMVEFPYRMGLKVGRMRVEMECLTIPQEITTEAVKRLSDQALEILKSGRCAQVIVRGLAALYVEPSSLNVSKGDQYKKPDKLDKWIVTVSDLVIDPETGEERLDERQTVISPGLRICALCRLEYHGSSSGHCFVKKKGKGKRWRAIGKSNHNRCCPRCLPGLSRDLQQQELNSQQALLSGGLVSLDKGGFMRR